MSYCIYAIEVRGYISETVMESTRCVCACVCVYVCVCARVCVCGFSVRAAVKCPSLTQGLCMGKWLAMSWVNNIKLHKPYSAPVVPLILGYCLSPLTIYYLPTQAVTVRERWNVGERRRGGQMQRRAAALKEARRVWHRGTDSWVMGSPFMHSAVHQRNVPLSHYDCT